ncbi:dNA mismatch repair protein MutS [Firmicutes bacterium CAG:475]|nr:dNA mismatch repair protein MutS [Firmicutes bacterium CAG:475]
MELNLTAQNKQEELVLKYLQDNASETLADKINNGTPFEKDGKPLLNKKTLSDFMKYACDEARKHAEKGANSACIDDQTVYGWAIHFFEEDSIVGTLYTLDGTEYKPTVKRVESNTVKAKPEPKKQENVQFSFFDNFTEQEVKDNKTDNSSVDTDENEVVEQNGNDEQKPVASKTPNGTFFEKYQALQQQNPAYVIAYRLGDFYEILGDKAVEIAREIDLTLTSRDCGLEERVAMIGFPYHASEIYFAKIAKTHDLLVVDTDGDTRFISQKGCKKTTQIDYETGEILGEALEPNNAIISKLFEIFGNTLEVQ